MITPITFNLDEGDAKDYHLVNRHELQKVKDTETLKRCVDELNLRVKHATKYYKSRYDERHKQWMRTLARPLKTEHKLSLCLDAIVAVNNQARSAKSRNSKF